jgi:hypothetical protein
MSAEIHLDETPPDTRIYISTLANLLDRRPNTVRGWIRSGRLPTDLHPLRKDGQGWRYWSPEQVERILEWMRDERMVPSAGLTHFDPDPEQVRKLLKGLRRPRLSRSNGRRAA